MDRSPGVNVVRCENGEFSVECPGCGEFIPVDSVEHEVGEGILRGHHTEPDLARYERHYREEH